MTLVSYNFKKGIDVPQYEWMAPAPFISYHGHSFTYDGSRYIYCAAQVGTTATTVSTTQLWRFCTWTNGWHFMVTLTSGNRGVDLDYDSINNCLWIIIGGGTTTWHVFNLALTTQTLCGTVVGAYSLGTVATVLPALADYGASIMAMDSNNYLTTIIDSGTVASGSTSTSLVDSTSDPSFSPLQVGLYAKFTSGALNGQARVITAASTDGTTLTTAAFGGTPAVGDTFQIIVPQGTATSATASTLTDSGASWTTNFYANSDVMIVSGTGAGQRFRIGSNTATVLTLAGAVAGNPRTGNFTVTPDATSVYAIVPSTDFLYFQPGSTSAALYKIDIIATTKAWTTLTSMPGIPSSGGDLKFPRQLSPFNLMQIRGNATANLYLYGIGANSWTTPTSLVGEQLTTGSSSVMIHGKRRVISFVQSAQRMLAYNVTNGVWEPAGTQPYAAGSAYDGKRACYAKSPDGVDWVYYLRPGGQEFYRMPLEWLPS